MVTARYLVIAGAYCSLLAVTARYRSLLLVPTFSVNDEVARILFHLLFSWIFPKMI